MDERPFVLNNYCSFSLLSHVCFPFSFFPRQRWEPHEITKMRSQLSRKQRTKKKLLEFLICISALLGLNSSKVQRERAPRCMLALAHRFLQQLLCMRTIYYEVVPHWPQRAPGKIRSLVHFHPHCQGHLQGRRRSGPNCRSILLYSKNALLSALVL